MKPNFKDIDIKKAVPQPNTEEWNAKNKIEKNWITPEQIPVKPVYTKEDLEGMEHLHYAAGLAPYLRGPYSVMYALAAITSWVTSFLACALPPLSIPFPTAGNSKDTRRPTRIINARTVVKVFIVEG